MALSHTTGRIVYVVAAKGPPVVPRKQDVRPAPKATKKIDPGVDDRPVPALSFSPSACSPFSLFNCLLLGHWTEFSYARLINCLT